MIVDEAVRGSVPPPWFWALSGLERIRALSLSQLSAPPVSRLLGIRPSHVGPGLGTWTMPATAWLQSFLGELEISMLAEAATTGVAMTTLPPGMDLEPLTLELNHFRPTRPESGNLHANARVVDAGRFLTVVHVEIEDSRGRKIAHGTSHLRTRRVEPQPPPAPADLTVVDEPAYLTGDPWARPLKVNLAPLDVFTEQNGLGILQQYAEGRFQAPIATLTGYQIEKVEYGRIATAWPANEWYCQFSRSVAPGCVAAFTNVSARTGALSVLNPGESFVGMAQSVWFLCDVPADGRLMHAQVVGVRHQNKLLTAQIHVYRDDGSVVALGQSIATVVAVAARQKSQITETKRILATLLFTDIVGSTDSAERLGDACWKDLLEQHHAVVRSEISRCDGVEIDTIGDGFFVRFESPGAAVRCACAVRNAVGRLGMKIRVAIHTGECEMQGRKLAGIAVHLAARIQGVAAPGEILVSSTVKDIVVGSGLCFEDRGMHVLKGVSEEWRLFSVVE